MKKLITTIAFALLLITAGAQERFTHEGNTLLYSATYNADGSHNTITAISINDIHISEDQNKSAWECYNEKKTQCKLNRACWEVCSENRACEIAWFAACVFDWWREVVRIFKVIKLIQS